METRTTLKMTDTASVSKEAQRLWKILCKQHNKTTPMPAVIVVFTKHVQSSGSYAVEYGKGIVKVYLGTDVIDAWETLAHEMNHAIGCSGHDRNFYYSLKQLVEKRFNTRISSFDWNRFGYACDWSIQQQLQNNI
jgi:hypothetical protein